MKVLLTTHRTSTNSRTLNWYSDDHTSGHSGCFDGPGCHACPLLQNCSTKKTCVIFHTMPAAARKKFLQVLLEKHSNQVVELSDILSDYPELLL